MRFFAPIFALFAAVAVVAQENAISHPEGGLHPTAGQQQTISWTNPSSGTVTIKLQDGTGVTPTDGVVLASGIPASALTATFTMPTDLVASSSYNFEIIDDTNPTNYNFSDQFSIAGATAVSSMVTSTATSSSSASSASSASTHSSSSSSSSNSSSSSSSASRTSSESASRTSTSATSTATTAAPNSNTNAASSLKVEGALIAMIAGAVALF